MIFKDLVLLPSGQIVGIKRQFIAFNCSFVARPSYSVTFLDSFRTPIKQTSHHGKCRSLEIRGAKFITIRKKMIYESKFFVPVFNHPSKMFE